MCGDQAARLLGELGGAPRARPVDLAATVRLGGEVGQQLWSHPCHGWHPVRPLSAGPGMNRARSGVGAMPVGALRKLCGTGGVNLHQMVVYPVDLVGGGRG
jgi:hypothetical protein